MAKPKKVVVAGLGEIGRPILELASRALDVVGVDVSPSAQRMERADILHVCYPFAIKDFIGETARYIDLFNPDVTIVNSTVAVGTTRAIAERTGAAVVNSPVRGNTPVWLRTCFTTRNLWERSTECTRNTRRNTSNRWA